MNILITGGLGFIGSHCAEKLFKKKHHITIITRELNIPHNLKKIKNDLNIIQADYSDKRILNDILNKIDIIIHTACTTVPENSTINPQYDIETNVIPTLNLIQSSLHHSIKKFIFLSSGGVIYGNTNTKYINEKTLTYPISSYGITKLMIEKYLYMYRIIENFNYLTLRISNAYGPGQLYKNNQGVISNWINKAKLNLPLEIWGNEKITRDYIYIDDITEAIERSLNQNVKGEYNIGSGKGTSLISLAKLIIKSVSSKSQIKIISDSERKFDILSNILDYTEFNKHTGWLPKTSLAEGIKKCLEY
jgi:UDP-glucose 4-epimerase